MPTVDLTSDRGGRPTAWAITNSDNQRIYNGANSYTYHVYQYVADGDTGASVNTGTSYAAPQVSGAAALLFEAFPNHTPEMIVDRLLATGNNSTSLIGTHTDKVTFGNGVEHGYNSTFGHGLMDVYAALNPITNSSYTQSNGNGGDGASELIEGDGEGQ